MSSTAVQKATIVLYRVIILLHSAIIHYSFKIHYFLYVFRGCPELGGDFKLFFKVRVAVTRKHPLHLNPVRSFVHSLSAANVEYKRAIRIQALCT